MSSNIPTVEEFENTHLPMARHNEFRSLMRGIKSSLENGRTRVAHYEGGIEGVMEQANAEVAKSGWCLKREEDNDYLHIKRLE